MKKLTKREEAKQLVKMLNERQKLTRRANGNPYIQVRYYKPGIWKTGWYTPHGCGWCDFRLNPAKRKKTK